MKKIGEPLLKKLVKIYKPSTVVFLGFKSYDLAMKTDEEGNPVVLFIGRLMKKEKLKVIVMQGGC